jgi:translation initiation factor IF-3
MNKEHRINYQIESSYIDLVLPDGEVKREVEFEKAMEIAEELELELMEVVPSKNGKLPICKILDYGKLKYRENKKKKPHKQVTKEIRFRYSISDHDLEIREKKIKNFIDKKYVVHYTIELRGRERELIKEGKIKIEESLKRFGDKVTWSPFKISSGSKTVRISTTISPV